MPQSPLIKMQVDACNFIKKQTLSQVFSCIFCEISKNTFFTEHLQTTASVETASWLGKKCLLIISENFEGNLKNVFT